MGVKVSQTKVSDFRKLKTAAKSAIRAYEGVKLEEVWEGVGVELRAHENNVEQLFYVAPRGEVSSVKVSFYGIKGLSLDEKGELVLEHEGGKHSFTRPVAFQQIGAEKKPKRTERIKPAM